MFILSAHSVIHHKNSDGAATFGAVHATKPLVAIAALRDDVSQF